jgi:hypothetical protein
VCNQHVTVDDEEKEFLRAYLLMDDCHRNHPDQKKNNKKKIQVVVWLVLPSHQKPWPVYLLFFFVSIRETVGRRRISHASIQQQQPRLTE